MGVSAHHSSMHVEAQRGQAYGSTSLLLCHHLSPQQAKLTKVVPERTPWSQRQNPFKDPGREASGFVSPAALIFQLALEKRDTAQGLWRREHSVLKCLLGRSHTVFGDWKSSRTRCLLAWVGRQVRRKEEEDIRQRRGIQGAWREVGMSSYFISFSFQECEGVKVNVKMAWGQARGLSGLAAKPEDLSSNPGPHMVEGQNRLQKIVLWYLLVHVCIHIPYTHNHIHKRCICTHTHYQIHNMHMIYIWIANGDSLDIKKSN